MGLSFNMSINDRTPMHPISSSKDNAKCIGVLRFLFEASQSSFIALAQKPFISAVPRPNSLPFNFVNLNGSVCQS